MEHKKDATIERKSKRSSKGDGERITIGSSEKTRKSIENLELNEDQDENEDDQIEESNVESPQKDVIKTETSEEKQERSIKRVSLSDEDDSYYLRYNKKLTFEPGIINMFGYCRVSTKLQSDFGSSIDTQIQLLVEECERQQYDENNRKVRYNLMRIYVDDGISGKNISERPGIINLKEHVSSLVSGKTHQKMGVLIPDLSRLTRSSMDLEIFVNWIKEENLKLRFIDNTIDMKTDAGMLMLKTLTSFFEFERKNSAFKTRLTLRSMSENGTLTGRCSYGWTCGVDENGRKIDVPVQEEQEGLNEIIRLYRENPEYKACEIKKIMNESDIVCFRGPGKNFRGKPTEKSIKRNENVKWTGLWTTQIIQKIMDLEDFKDRKKKIKELGTHVNIMKKDETVIQLIKDYLDETNGYDAESFNYSKIARMIDDKNIFHKKMNRNYIKEMMLAARIIKPQSKLNNNVDVRKVIKKVIKLVKKYQIETYVILTNILLEKEVPLIGKRKSWNPTNVRDMFKQYKLDFTTILEDEWTYKDWLKDMYGEEEETNQTEDNLDKEK